MDPGTDGDDQTDVLSTHTLDKSQNGIMENMQTKTPGSIVPDSHLQRHMHNKIRARSYYQTSTRTGRGIDMRTAKEGRNIAKRPDQSLNDGKGERERPVAAQPEGLDFSEKCRVLILS